MLLFLALRNFPPHNFPLRSRKRRQLEDGVTMFCTGAGILTHKERGLLLNHVNCMIFTSSIGCDIVAAQCNTS